MTLRDLANLTAAARGHWVLCGSAETVADTLQHWFEAGAADGFNVMPPYFHEGFSDFVDLVVPLLQQARPVPARLRGHDAARPPGPGATPPGRAGRARWVTSDDASVRWGDAGALGAGRRRPPEEVAREAGRRRDSELRRPRRRARRRHRTPDRYRPTARLLEMTTMPISDRMPCQASPARTPAARPAE